MLDDVGKNAQGSSEGTIGRRKTGQNLKRVTGMNQDLKQERSNLAYRKTESSGSSGNTKFSCLDLRLFWDSFRCSYDDPFRFFSMARMLFGET
jgi:hypothetical protein